MFFCFVTDANSCVCIEYYNNTINHNWCISNIYRFSSIVWNLEIFHKQSQHIRAFLLYIYHTEIKNSVLQTSKHVLSSSLDCIYTRQHVASNICDYYLRKEICSIFAKKNNKTALQFD